MFVVCCVSSGLCDGLITRSDSYRVCGCVLIVFDLETSTMRRLGTELGCCTYRIHTIHRSNRGAEVYITLHTVVNISLTWQITSDGNSPLAEKKKIFRSFISVHKRTKEGCFKQRL